MVQDGYYIQVDEDRPKTPKPALSVIAICCFCLILGVAVHGTTWTRSFDGIEQPMVSSKMMPTALIGALRNPWLQRPMRATTNLAPRVGKAARRGPRPVHAVREVEMPALSSTMTEGKVVEWLKKPGEPISKGESLVIIESDKADMEVESFYDGILGGVVVDDGGSASVGTPIAYIAEEESELDEAKAKVSGASSAASAPAPAAAAPAPPPAPAAPPPAPPVAAASASGKTFALPSAKELAKKHRIDLATVKGTGPYGRITGADVEAAAGIVKPAPAPPPPAASPAVAAAAAPPPIDKSMRGKVVPFTALQAAVSKNMVATLAVPEFRVSYTVKMDAFEALYKQLKPKGVTLTALIAKAVGVALAKHSIMNAAYSDAGIAYNEHVNVAVAVAMPDGGLITPVLKDADSIDIYQLSRNWGDLVKRARSKKLAPDEFNSGTFTVSNLGMFGVNKFDALLPVGTAGILAIGGTKSVVAADESNKLGVERQMTVTLTADHRIVYGADAAEFLKTLAAIMQSPEQLVF